MHATSLSRRQSGNRRKAHSYRYGSAKADGLFWVDSGQQRALGGMTDIGAERKPMFESAASGFGPKPDLDECAPDRLSNTDCRPSPAPSNSR